MVDDYTKQMSEQEKIIFIKMFSKLIKIDNTANNDEVKFLDVISSKYGISKSNVIEVIKNIDSIDYIAEAKKITNRQIALELIKELCLLANIDGDLDDSELDVIIDIALAMGIEEEKIIFINRWVLDSLILEKAGKIIMEKKHE